LVVKPFRRAVGKRRLVQKCAVGDQNFGGADLYLPPVNRQIEVATPEAVYRASHAR
jgi:hypothetical protein